MPKRKLVTLSTVHNLLRLANDQLASSLSQAMKAEICTNIERLLHDTKMYAGFNYNYWMDCGCDDWNNSGKFEGHKEVFIIGKDGYNAKQNKDDNFVSASQGEYSRTYFIHTDLKNAGTL